MAEVPDVNLRELQRIFTAYLFFIIHMGGYQGMWNVDDKIKESVWKVKG